MESDFVQQSISINKGMGTRGKNIGAFITHRFVDQSALFLTFLERDDNEQILRTAHDSTTVMGEHITDVQNAYFTVTGTLCELMFLMRDTVYPEIFSQYENVDINRTSDVDAMLVQLSQFLQILKVEGVVVNSQSGGE